MTEEIEPTKNQVNMAQAFYNTYRIVMMDAPDIELGDILIAGTVFIGMLVADVEEKGSATRVQSRQLRKTVIKGVTQSLREVKK